MEWTKYLPGYDKMTSFERAEMKRAMEESSGPHIYANRNSVKFLLLCHIKNHLSALSL